MLREPAPLISTFETKTGVNAPLELPYVTVPETEPVTVTLPPAVFVHGVFSLYIKAANPTGLDAPGGATTLKFRLSSTPLPCMSVEPNSEIARTPGESLLTVNT